MHLIFVVLLFKTSCLPPSSPLALGVTWIPVFLFLGFRFRLRWGELGFSLFPCMLVRWRSPFSFGTEGDPSFFQGLMLFTDWMEREGMFSRS